MILNYYGEEEVRILFERLMFAPKELREEIREYIIKEEYELDEDDFLKLLTFENVDEAFNYYDKLDTAARESFVYILNKFDNKMLVNVMDKLFDERTLEILSLSLKNEIQKLNDIKKLGVGYPGITKYTEEAKFETTTVLEIVETAYKKK